MRAGWLSYIRRAYPADGATDSGPVVGEGTFVVPGPGCRVYAAAGCCEQRSPVLDDAKGLLFAMNSNQKQDFWF